MTERDDQATGNLRVAGERRLTAAEFRHLAAVPAAVEWFAIIDNPRTRRAYQGDLQNFCGFVGLTMAEEFRPLNGRTCWPGAPSLSGAGWPACSVICRRTTPPPLATRRMGSSGPRSKLTRARRRPSAITRRKRCWRHLIQDAGRACAIGRFWRCCCNAACAAKKRRY